MSPRSADTAVTATSSDQASAGEQAVLGRLFNSFPKSLAFTRDSSPAFRGELLGENPEAPDNPRVIALKALVDQFADSDATGLDISSADGLLSDVLRLLADQTRVNPLKYVSHGTDHSIRVMAWSWQIYDGMPTVRRGLVARYQLPEPRVRFALLLTALLHDVGYADLADHKLPKWLHAPAGGKMVRSLLDTGGRGERIGGGGAALAEDIVRAITEHNFDDDECLWREGPAYAASCEVTVDPLARVDDPLSATTPLLHCSESCKYSRVYTPADAGQDPISFVTRLADNLDAAYDRLTPFQRRTPTLQYLSRLYVDAPVRAAVVAKDDAAIEQGRARVESEVPGLDAVGKDADMIHYSNPETFLHFYSNWIVKGMKVTDDGNSATLKVSLREDVPKDLAFADHPGAGLYQINRLAGASGSLTVDNRPLLDFINVELSQPVTGIQDGQRLPLRAFTRREKFDASGPSGSFCGNSCELTQFLTSSPESCLDAEDRATECPTGFGSISSFADLTYPTNGREPRRHIVVAGDTLFNIAAQYLGNGDRYMELAQANKINDPGHIQLGEAITIP